MIRFCLALGILLASAEVSTAGDLQPLVEARQALDDGLPSVALTRLRPVSAEKLTPQDRRKYDTLMARILNETGRYQESADLLKPIAQDDETKFLLARAYNALGDKKSALPLFAELTTSPQYGRRSVLIESSILQGLGRLAEANDILKKYGANHPSDNAVSFARADILIDAGDSHVAAQLLQSVPASNPGEVAVRDFLLAQARLASGHRDEAEKLLKDIKMPPAALAARVVIARAEVLLGNGDAAGAEKVLEAFIDENGKSPDLDDAFAELDKVYQRQGVVSGSELKRWVADTENPQRSALASFYLAGNEFRNSKTERSRVLYQDFLGKYPAHQLADAARIKLASIQLNGGDSGAALKTLAGAGQDGKVSFLRGSVEAAEGAYTAAAQSFLNASQDQSLRAEALFNAAVCSALAGTPTEQNRALKEVALLDPSGEKQRRIQLTQALFLASQGKPEAVTLLKTLAASDGPMGQRARLVLAEWDFGQHKYADATADLRQVANSDPAQRERAQYLAVFLADAGGGEGSSKVIDLAEAFLKEFPESAFAPEIHMKLAEILFRRGDYLGARAQFDAVADGAPNSPLADSASLLSAQAMARSMDPAAMEEAVATYENIAGEKGPLAFRARLDQAALLNALHRPKDALAIYDSILKEKPDNNDERYAALMAKGITLFSLGAADPENYQQAITVWQEISVDPNGSPRWKNEALTRMGDAYAKLGNSEAALNCYYSVFSQGQKGEPEYFWFYKAGFAAGELLGSQKLWNEAIAVYEKLGSFDGPRAEEARNRVNALRLENFLWEN